MSTAGQVNSYDVMDEDLFSYEIISSGAFVLIPPNIFPSAEQLGLHPRNHTLRCRSFIKHPQIASEHFSLCAGPF